MAPNPNLEAEVIRLKKQVEELEAYKDARELERAGYRRFCLLCGSEWTNVSYEFCEYPHCRETLQRVLVTEPCGGELTRAEGWSFLLDVPVLKDSYKCTRCKREYLFGDAVLTKIPSLLISFDGDIVLPRRIPNPSLSRGKQILEWAANHPTESAPFREVVRFDEDIRYLKQLRKLRKELSERAARELLRKDW